MEFVNNGTLAAASNATEPQTCNLTTMGEANFLECSLGLRYPLVTRTMPITVIYSVIFVTGIFGNVSTCVVIARNNHMHTATNCYLFSLACSDIMILLLGMPFDIYVTWEQYPWTFGTALCFMKGFLLEMTTNASILCITAFTVERYVAICHPIWAHTLSKISRAVKMITMIWLVACAVAIPHGYINEVNYLQDDAGKDISASSWCAVDFQSSDNAQRQLLLVLFAFFFFFLVPMSIIAVLYVRIGLVLSNSGLVRQNSDDKTPSNREARKAVIKMLVAVVVGFFVCWAPFQAQRLMFIYYTYTNTWTDIAIRTNDWIFVIVGILYYTSSTINPILYNLISKKYRIAFQHTLCSCFTQTRRRTNKMRGFNSSVSSSYYPVGRGDSRAETRVSTMEAAAYGGYVNGHARCPTPNTVAEDFV